MSESYHTFYSKTIPANPPTYLRTKIHHYWLIPCLNPSRPCMMMPMINCERRGTRLWNYGESSRERIFFLAKTAITCINGVKFEAPSTIEIFPSLYLGPFFTENVCRTPRSLRRNVTPLKKMNQSKLLQKGANFVWKCHTSHLPFFDLVTKSKKGKNGLKLLRKSYFWVTSKFFLHDWSNPSISIPNLYRIQKRTDASIGGSRSDFFESQSTIKKVDWTVMIQRYTIFLMCAIEFPDDFPSLVLPLPSVTAGYVVYFGWGSFDFCLGAVFATLEKQQKKTVFG